MNLDSRSIPYRVLENAGRLVFVAVLGVVSSSGGGSFDPAALVGIALLGGVAVVGWEVARVRRFRYELTTDTFDIGSGVFSRREREIPYERIQNVDISQNVVQRALEIAEVRIETAGGNATEAVLQYVSRAEADRLQTALSEHKRTAGDGPTDAEARAGGDSRELFALSRRELGVLGFVSADLRLLGLVSVGLSAVAPRLAQRLRPGPDAVSLLGPAAALAGIVALWVLSAGSSALRYWGFVLRRGNEELRYERGLLQRYSGTIPLEKVQTLRLQENVLARGLGYASLVVETAGYGPGGDSGPQSAVPIAERDRAVALAREIEPIGDVAFTRPPKRARTRYAARYTIVVAVLGGLLAGVAAVTGWAVPWPFAATLLVFVPPAAHLTWANRGYHVDDEYVITRNGFWRRETVVVPYDRVQTVESSQSIFQRRRELGSVVVDTASSGGVFGTEAAAVDVAADRAERLRETVLSRFSARMAAG